MTTSFNVSNHVWQLGKELGSVNVKTVCCEIAVLFWGCGATYTMTIITLEELNGYHEQLENA